MIEVGKVGSHTDKGGNQQYGACLEEPGKRLVAPRIFKVCSCDEQDDEQEVVGHLHVVGHDLQGDEEGCEYAACQQLAPVGEHDARYCGRDVGKGDELPDVSGGYQDKEGPHDAAQACQPCRYAECPQQDVEAQHQDKRQVDIGGQEELVYFLCPLQRYGRVVGRGYLVGRHSAEEGIGPAGAFACLFVILFGFLSGTGTGSNVMLEQNAVLYVRRKKVDEGNQNKCQNGNEVGKNLLYHLCWVMVYVGSRKGEESTPLTPNLNFSGKLIHKY